MFTKAVLEKELSKKDNELYRKNNNIKDLIDLAQSCTGQVCTRRNEGCGYVDIEGFNEEGVIANRAVCNVSANNSTPEELEKYLEKMKARDDICIQYTRTPLPQSGGGIVVGTTDGNVVGTTDGNVVGTIIVDDVGSVR